MDAQQFVAEFGHMANAPGGVAKLRELVLQFAISGRLTQRVPFDIAATELLKINYEKKQTLVSQGKQKRQPETKPVDLLYVPWALPNEWLWVRLGTVTNYGDAPKVELAEVTDETWVLELEDIEKTSSRLLVRVIARDRRFQSAKNSFPAGSILYGKLRPYLDKVVIADSPGVCTTEICPISFFEGIIPDYLRWYLKSSYFIAYANGSTHGMNLPRLGTDAAREALFPFPPGKEQARIVAKVDELMALCDKLEAQQQARETRKAVLAQALLTRFAEEPTQANLHSLFHSSRAITPADLRTAIRNLSIRAKLVPQHPGDEPAVTNLAQIENEKTALIETRKLRPPRLSDTTMTREMQYQLPESWKWFLFGDVVFFQEGPGIRNWQFKEAGIKLLNVQNIVKEKLVLENTSRFVAVNEFEDKYRHFQVEDGDILFASSGASWGKSAIFSNPGYRVMLNTSMIRLKFFSRRCDDSYLLNFLRTEFFSKQMAIQLAGIQPNFGSTHLGCVYIPLPPLAEQRRIVAKVDELMALVDKLETQLATANTVGKRLVETVVSTLAGIATSEEQDLTVKAPPTELIAGLRLGRLPDIKQQAPLATELARHQGSMAVRDLWQRFGGDIDAFYAQLKIEVTSGWILEPAVAEMRTKQTTATDA